MILGTGIDLAEVGRIRDAIGRHESDRNGLETRRALGGF